MAEDARGEAGFSLIEILAALAIFGVLTALVFTNVRGVVDRARRTEAIAQLTAIVEKAREESLRTSLPVSLSSVVNELTEREGSALPDIEVSDEIIIHPPGACTAGEGAIMLPSGVAKFRIRPITCEVFF